MRRGRERRLPVGTVTFLLTDIVGSTRLWEEDPARMPAALLLHDEIVDGAVSAANGHVVRPRGEGDSKFAVFREATQATAAACRMMRDLTNASWPTHIPIQIRAGVHTGVADLRAGDYYGSAVNRCARIRSLAHPGQVLVSDATAQLCRNDHPGDAGLQELGVYSLKDLRDPERLHQLTGPGLRTDFPPLVAEALRRTNVPNLIGPTLGRRAEIEKCIGATSNLVTLVGPGGVGKTRVAQAAAHHWLESRSGGAWFIDVTALRTDRDVVDAVVETVLLPSDSARSRYDELADVTSQGCLVILDNCEVNLDAVAAAAQELARRAPRLRVVATSREPIGSLGELLIPVEPLVVPSEDAAVDVDELSRVEAVQLLLHRTAAVAPEFQLSDHNAAHVAELVRHLDGVPLAIELAARRLRSMSPAQLTERLGDRFDLLVDGPRTATPRHQSLRALVDWSWDLCSVEERRAWVAASTFSGGFSLEAAEAVLPHVTSAPPGELLGQMVAKSLVAAEVDWERPRFRMLDTLREYGNAHLSLLPDPELFRRKQTEYFVSLITEAEAGLRTEADASHLAQLDDESANLRSVFSWSLAAAPELACQLAASSWVHWWVRGRISEGRTYLDHSLAIVTDPQVETKLHAGAAILAVFQEDAAAVTDHAAAALGGPADDAAPEWWLAAAAAAGAVASLAFGSSPSMMDVAAARRFADRSLAVATASDDPTAVAFAQQAAGYLALAAHDLDTARDAFQTGLAAARRSGWRRLISRLQGNLADLQVARRQLHEAATAYQELAAIGNEDGDLLLEVYALSRLAHIEADLGRPAAARAHIDAAIELKQRYLPVEAMYDLVDLRRRLSA